MSLDNEESVGRAHDAALPPRAGGRPRRGLAQRRPGLILGLWFGAAAAAYAALFSYQVALGEPQRALDSPTAWLLTMLLHLPYLIILLLLGFGFVERLGYFRRGRQPHRPGRLPAAWPTVCIQLPMFNEDAVAARVIEAAAAIRWPQGRIAVQVLDDSTDAPTRTMVREACARVQARTGVPCRWVHRSDRRGYKAGALEAGRHQTDAEFIAIFDADFVPPPDYLQRAMPHFYKADGTPQGDLALVQAQWAHLNEDESLLTEAQALWVDDHHSLQMAWRSANLGFVNFTGTAGVWRASAIQAVGGWRSTSLVEDCELSLRALFGGYRTRFVRQLAAPAELPQTLAAYRLQQKRWTQGWAQILRLHLATLLGSYRTNLARKAFLTYLVCICWQWPLWMSWIVLFPFLIANGLWFGVLGSDVALLVYLAPPLVFAVLASIVATAETRHGDGPRQRSFTRRCARILPYLVIHTGMLPHHVCAFFEGLFGPMHAEFERTPKTASVTALAGRDTGAEATAPAPLAPAGATRRKLSKTAYQLAEAAFVVSQTAWAVYFGSQGMVMATLASAWVAACVLSLRVVPLLAGALKQRRTAAAEFAR